MIKILNLPKINLSEIWYLKDKPGFFSKKPGYYSYNVTEQTRKLIYSLFPKDFFDSKSQIMAQIITAGVDGVIHKDVSRLFAINYLLDNGGGPGLASVLCGSDLGFLFGGSLLRLGSDASLLH